MQLFRSPKYFFSALFIIVAFYLATHMAGLTRLPVFADEAIYIRWAQLIIDDSNQYFFFPLNDGKTPLFIWQLIPALATFDDPLFAARVVSVIGGLVQIFAIIWLVRELKGGSIAQIFSAVFVTVLPFWFLHHRMALMDGWLTVWITLALVFLLRSIRLKSVPLAVVSGICVGASLLTKVPAVLALPTLVFFGWASVDTKKAGWSFLKFIVVSGAAGLILFASLILAPSFSQLFSRGGDFLFSLSDVMQGIWFTTIKNTPSYFNYFWTYATPPVFLLFIAGLFTKQNWKRTVAIWLSFLVFYLPIALMGISVFPRYLFPGMLFVTLGAAFFLEYLVETQKSLGKWLAIAAMIITILFSLPFMYYLSANPNKTPFVSADTMQYLTEWSAGHGNWEVFQKLQADSKTQRIAVATEGYFGTLPDGLVMYVHNKNLENIAIDGVGQPIFGIPDELIKKRDEYDRFWLVVNSHRLEFELPTHMLLASYCRPYDAPCLQVWDVTELVRASE